MLALKGRYIVHLIICVALSGIALSGLTWEVILYPGRCPGYIKPFQDNKNRLPKIRYNQKLKKT